MNALCRRAVLLAGMLLALLPLASAALPTGPSTADAQTAAVQPSGRLLYLVRGDVWQLDLATGERRLFLDVVPGLITHAAHSPDRGRIAYSVLHLTPTYRVTGSEIVVTDADGANFTPIVRTDGTSASVRWPTWNGDAALAYTLTDLTTGWQRIEEIDLSSNVQTVLADGGSSPASSPDGQWLAYARSTNRGWSIWSLHRPSSTSRQLIHESWFVDADVPTFSPDGSTIALVAAGDGPADGGQSVGHVWEWAARQLTSVAYAHDVAGAEMNLWLVHPDGSGLRRLALLANELSYPTWSPDGQHIAVWGNQGLQLVQVASGAVQLLTDESNNAPISWGY